VGHGAVIESAIGATDNEVNARLRHGGHLNRHQFAVRVEPLAARWRWASVNTHEGWPPGDGGRAPPVVD
jgi:hypothetical protein